MADPPQQNQALQNLAAAPQLNQNGFDFSGYWYKGVENVADRLLQYIEGTQTYDNMRHKDMSWPMYIKWTDAWNQQHKLTMKESGKESEVTMWFPVRNKEIIWHCASGSVRTGFDAECTWACVTFKYVASDWINNHGIRIAFTGFKSVDAKAHAGDWARVKLAVDAAKDVSEILVNVGQAAESVGNAAAK